jgi:hypothetical protein
MANYAESERLKDMAETMISDHHEHLKEAVIGYVMKEYDQERPNPGTRSARPGKKRRLGKVRCYDTITQMLTGYHFVIVLDQRPWDMLDVNEQEAVLDAELARLGWDADGPYLKDPDLAVFSDVVARHGVYNPEIEEFFKKTAQLSLFEKAS